MLDERPHRVTPRRTRADLDARPRHACRRMPDTEVEIDALHEVFEDAFGRVFRGEVENDDFNRLRRRGAHARRRGRRAARLRQVSAADRLCAVAVVHRGHARRARGHRRACWSSCSSCASIPDERRRRGREAPPSRYARSRHALEEVDNLSEDRVLRQYLALIHGDARAPTSGAATRGKPQRFLSFKFDPAKVPGLPEPKPMFEIFVYSTRFEGVHLRGGKVARGGLRWSDRPEDFRTEVLGLVKAQMVKNTVIVPVGSKGGFVLKRAAARPIATPYMKEGVACYQDYLRGLLDLTDNRVGDKIVPPPRVKRHDPDDPYLVVAADKGTATFSDYANGISSGVRLLARRRFRVGRLGRLRPQGDGHHRARRVGSRSSATSAKWASTRRRPISPSPASATCRATCSATACCCRGTSGSSPRSTIATSFLDPNPDPGDDASSSASACSSCRARRGPITTSR